MKLDPKTIGVMKNFSSINPSIIINEGNVLKTISPGKTVMAKATVPDKFPSKASIYNLNRFLSLLSTFDDPDVSFGETSFVVTDKSGDKNAPYKFADESTIKAPPEKEIVLPTTDISVTLNTDILNEIEKVLGILGLPEIAIVGDGKEITLQAIDSKVPGGDSVRKKLGTTDKTFRAIFKAENMRLMPGTYSVSVSAKGISHFKGENVDYWIAVESSSTF
jgi:hypothetical protein